MSEKKTEGWKCPECDTEMVICDEAGIGVLNTLAEDKANLLVDSMNKSDCDHCGGTGLVDMIGCPVCHYFAGQKHGADTEREAIAEWLEGGCGWGCGTVTVRIIQDIRNGEHREKNNGRKSQ